MTWTNPCRHSDGSSLQSLGTTCTAAASGRVSIERGGRRQTQTWEQQECRSRDRLPIRWGQTLPENAKDPVEEPGNGAQRSTAIQNMGAA